MTTLAAHARSTDAHPSPLARPAELARWLLGVALIVFVMVVVGGITRLTESGLSITKWELVTGVLPPLDDVAWGRAFEAYKQVPQYAAIHSEMTLAQFKGIYFWEWAHRILGRVTGLAVLLPLVWFWVRGAIPAGFKPRLLVLFALVCLQGAVGMWMVRSGLLEGVAVSHYRLSIHLLLAFTLLGALVWTALDLRALARDPAARPARLTGLAAGVGAVLGVQLLYGAWVAGMDAGKVTRHWPMMGPGQFLPPGVDWSHGLAWAATADPFLVHFIHRWWAWAALAAVAVLARAAKRAGVRRASVALHAVVGTQVLLGIAVVTSGVLLPLAAIHQAMAAALVAAFALGAHAIGRDGANALPVRG